MLLLRKLSGVVLMLFIVQVGYVAEVEPIRDNACPDGWSLTDSVIPQIRPTTTPWGEGTEDKSIAKSHLSGSNPVITINTDPVTNDDLVDDLLTVASECLRYRNMLVDGEKYYPPSPSVERDITVGFITASVF